MLTVILFSMRSGKRCTVWTQIKSKMQTKHRLQKQHHTTKETPESNKCVLVIADLLSV